MQVISVRKYFETNLMLRFDSSAFLGAWVSLTQESTTPKFSTFFSLNVRLHETALSESSRLRHDKNRITQYPTPIVHKHDTRLRMSKSQNTAFFRNIKSLTTTHKFTGKILMLYLFHSSFSRNSRSITT